MTSWADVASKALDFLMKPSGLSVFFILTLVLLGVYFYPMHMVNEGFAQQGDRIVAAIREHCTNHTRTDTVRISEKR